MYLSNYSNYKSKTTMNPSSIHMQTNGHYFIYIRSITTFLYEYSVYMYSTCAVLYFHFMYVNYYIMSVPPHVMVVRLRQLLDA
jgi:hypothetical protein